MFVRYAETTEQRLALWSQLQIIRPLDIALLRALPDSALLTEPELLLLMLTSAQLSQGHVCLDASIADVRLLLPALLRTGEAASELMDYFNQQSLTSVQSALVPAALTTKACESPKLAGEELDAKRRLISVEPTAGANQGLLVQPTPFVCRGTRLYLWRYAVAEQQISQYISRQQQGLQPGTFTTEADLAQAVQTLQQLFPKAQRNASNTEAETDSDIESEPDWQLQACALAFARPFAVITGGPGTGKTTTVTKLLLLLCAANPKVQLVLAAPTGKAAARLTESISQSADQFASTWPQAAAVVASQKAVTVHRLLSPKADGSGFAYGRGRCLPADVVIVDEASMLDITLFAALLEALSPQSRLILLGDKDQLASVEAGAVLAELCAHADEGRYSTQTAQLLASLTGQQLPSRYLSATPDALDQQVMMLRVSHRFSSNSGIGQLARLINQGDSTGVSRLLQQDLPDVSALSLANTAQLTDFMLGQLRDYLNEAASPLQAAASATQALALHKLLAKFQLLTALRQGPDGSEQLNQTIETQIRRRWRYDSQELWYPGRAIIIRQNDYSSGLMNGDIGICCLVDGTLRLAFLQADSGVRWLLPGRLPAYEAAFALTVHKSQGSEYHHAALLLPAFWSPVLTRELIYTAVTRARQQFSLICPVPQVLQQAINSKTARNGGLRLS